MSHLGKTGYSEVSHQIITLTELSASASPGDVSLFPLVALLRFPFCESEKQKISTENCQPRAHNLNQKVLNTENGART